jgi:hypothetical protein
MVDRADGLIDDGLPFGHLDNVADAGFVNVRACFPRGVRHKAGPNALQKKLVEGLR